MSIIIRGFKVWDGALKNAPPQLRKAIPADLKVAIEKGREESYRLCRVDTGYLRSQTGTEVKGTKAKLFNQVDYASVHEFGSRNISSQPFIRPGIILAMEVFIQLMKSKGFK